MRAIDRIGRVGVDASKDERDGRDGGYPQTPGERFGAAEARGEAVGQAVAEAQRRYEEEHPEAAAEAALWAGIGALGAERDDGEEKSDAELIEQVLAKAAVIAGTAPRASSPSGLPAPVVIDRRRRRGGVVLAIASLAAAAAVALALTNGLREDDVDTVRAVATHDRPAEELAGQEAARGPAEVPPAPPEVKVPRSPVAAPLAAPLAVGGGPQVAAPAVAPVTVAGPSADDLLRRAQGLLQAGRTAEAMDAYRDLVARRPGSGEARTALVSLGQLSLDQGHADEALGYLDHYLAGAPAPLREEASFLRIEALQRLGRAGEAEAAIGEFLERYPESVHAERLRIEGPPRRRLRATSGYLHVRRGARWWRPRPPAPGASRPDPRG